MRAIQERMSKVKVLLINGSPNEKGCTYTALQEAPIFTNFIR